MYQCSYQEILVMDNIAYKVGLKNDNEFQYKLDKPLENRIKFSNHYSQLQPDFVSIICEPHRSFKKSGQGLVKSTILLVKKSDTVTNLKKTIISTMNLILKSEEVLYIFSQNVILLGVDTIEQVYDRYQDKEDKLLYIKYTTQDSFG